MVPPTASTKSVPQDPTKGGRDPTFVPVEEAHTLEEKAELFRSARGQIQPTSRRKGP